MFRSCLSIKAPIALLMIPSGPPSPWITRPPPLPFRPTLHPGLPAGTLLTVRLESSFSITEARVGKTFNASVAAPVILDGETLIAPGTPVSGRVESAQAPLDEAGPMPKPALVRLSLNTLTIDGRRLPLQTSNLFTKATLRQDSSQSLGSKRTSADYLLLRGRQLHLSLELSVGFIGCKFHSGWSVSGFLEISTEGPCRLIPPLLHPFIPGVIHNPILYEAAKLKSAFSVMKTQIRRWPSQQGRYRDGQRNAL